MGAPLRVALKHLASWTIAPSTDGLISLVHRPMESFFLVPQEFVEARCTAGLSNASPCIWSSSPPPELKGSLVEALSTNVGFVSFVIFPRHIGGKKFDKTVWSLSISYAYVNYHIKNSVQRDSCTPG